MRHSKKKINQNSITSSSNSLSNKLLIFLLIFCLIPISANSSSIIKTPQYAYVKNNLFLFSLDKLQLFDIAINNTDLDEPFETICATPEDYLIFYSYAYGTVLKQFDDIYDNGIANISVKITKIMNCSTELSIQLDTVEFPRKNINILSLKDFSDGIYKVTVTTTTIANEYSDYLYETAEINNISNFYFSIGEPQTLKGHTEAPFFPTLYNNSETANIAFKPSLNKKHPSAKNYNVTLDSVFSFEKASAKGSYDRHIKITDNASKIIYCVEGTNEFKTFNVGDSIKISDIVTEVGLYYIELRYIYDDGCIGELSSMICINVLE